MKIKILQPTKIEVTTLRAVLPVNYEDEDIPYDFPFRDGDTLTLEIDIDTGKINNWPAGYVCEIECMKVCDGGVYTLFGPDGNEIATLEDYVPTGVFPGGDSDYISLDIREDGVIKNWKKNLSFSEFFPQGEASH